MKDLNIILEGEDIRLEKTEPNDVLIILFNTVKLMDLIKNNFDYGDYYITSLKTGSIAASISCPPDYTEMLSFIQMNIKSGFEKIKNYLEPLQEMKKIAHKYNAVFSFKENTRSILSIDKDLEFSSIDSIINVILSEFGIIERIGGAEPSMVFKNRHSERFSIPLSQEEAVNYSGLLYKEVKVKLACKMDFTTKKIIQCGLTDLTKLEDNQTIENFNNITNSIKTKIKGIKNPSDFIHNQRHEEDE